MPTAAKAVRAHGLSRSPYLRPVMKVECPCALQCLVVLPVCHGSGARAAKTTALCVAGLVSGSPAKGFAFTSACASGQYGLNEESGWSNTAAAPWC